MGHIWPATFLHTLKSHHRGPWDLLGHSHTHLIRSCPPLLSGWSIRVKALQSQNYLLSGSSKEKIPGLSQKFSNFVSIRVIWKAYSNTDCRPHPRVSHSAGWRVEEGAIWLEFVFLTSSQVMLMR